MAKPSKPIEKRTPPKAADGKKKGPTFKAQTTSRKGQGASMGQALISGKAAKRLEPRTQTPTMPGSPIPGLNQIDGDSVVTPQRLYYYKLTKWSPIRHLTPELLGQYFDLWEQGYIRYFALLAKAIEHRDPTLSTVVPKRKASVKRLKYQILIMKGLDDGQKAEAEAHKKELEYFYNNLTCSSSIDLNLKAGLPMLLDQMMESRGYRWAVHEMIFKPSPDGLTAQFNFIPLWFFENRTGKLRFLEMDYQLDGRELKDGSFMVTTSSDCLMEPSSVAYMFWSLAMKWWLTYIEGHAMPIKVGKTAAALGSDNYEKFKAVLQQMNSDSVVAVGKDDEIESMDLANSGELPYPKLCDEMKRNIVSLWRGADLSTISGKTTQGGQGASLQGKEEYYLTCDDAGMLGETFNMNVDPLVIGWRFGEGVKPLAYFKLVVPPNIEAAQDMQMFDKFIKDWGIEVGKEQAREHFGMEKMHLDDEAIIPAPDPAMVKALTGTQLQDQEELEAANIRLINPDVNQQLLTAAHAQLVTDTFKALEPLREAVKALIDLPNEARPAAYSNFKSHMPELLAKMNRNPVNAKPLYEAMTSAWFNALTNAEVVHR